MTTRPRPAGLSSRARAPQPVVEWPTAAVGVGVFGAYLALMRFGAGWPWPITVAALALVSGWHGSYQHETVHGHPTRWKWLNHAIAWIPFGVMYPFERYVETHNDHHAADHRLTLPGQDTESNYVTPAMWAAAGRVRRGWWWAHRTLAGRLVAGPARWLSGTWWREARAVAGGDRRAVRIWAMHLAGVAGVVWLATRWGLPAWQYVLGAGYLGTSVTMVRSFAEHRAVTSGSRTAVVEAGWFASLLYLNNNLHHAHHARPAEPWYRLPVLARELGSAEIAAAGAGRYAGGYLEQFRHFLFRPIDHPVNPLLGPVTGVVRPSGTSDARS